MCCEIQDIRVVSSYLCPFEGSVRQLTNLRQVHIVSLQPETLRAQLEGRQREVRMKRGRKKEGGVLMDRWIDNVLMTQDPPQRRCCLSVSLNTFISTPCSCLTFCRTCLSSVSSPLLRPSFCFTSNGWC